MFHILCAPSTCGIFLFPSSTDYRYGHCGAIHWIEERVTKSSKNNPQFYCCNNDQIELPRINDTPEELRHLLSETYINNDGKEVFTECTQHFQQFIRAYNNVIAFTSLAAEIDERITNNTHGVYSLRIRADLYRRLGALLPRITNALNMHKSGCTTAMI